MLRASGLVAVVGLLGIVTAGSACPGPPTHFLVPGLIQQLRWAVQVAARVGVAVWLVAGASARAEYPTYVSSSLSLVPPGSGNTYAFELELEGTLAFVAANQGGLIIVDVSDPAVPRQVGGIDTPAAVHAVDVVGHLAYLADGQISTFGDPRLGGLRIIDVSDPREPIEVGFAGTPGNAIDVEVRGNFAFVVDTVAGYDWPEALRVFDVADPEAPVEVGSLLLPWHENAGAYFRAVDVRGSLAVVTTDDGDEPTSRLVAIDVSDPSHPVEVGRLNGVGGGYDVQLVGDLAYHGPSGLTIVDLSIPAAPSVLSRVDGLSGSGIEIAGGLAYLNDWPSGFTVLDVSNPLEPRRVGSRPAVGAAGGDVEVANGIAYLLGAGGMLSVQGFDATAPACSDNLDDDGDAKIDASDQGCSAPQDPSERFDCEDGLDNDGDGVVDSADPGCFAPEDGTEQFDCSDAIDNDGDGPIDLADFDCSSANDPREQPACSDGVDNDADGLVDYPSDAQCSDATDATELSDCSDGHDNDGDGLTDFPLDPGCWDPRGLVEDPQCGDGLDNDFDTLADQDDPECSSAWDDSEDRISECDDGADNDADGWIDTPLDPGCTDPADPYEAVQFMGPGSHVIDGSTALPDDTVRIAPFLCSIGYAGPEYCPTEVRLIGGGVVPSQLQVVQSIFDMTGGTVGGDILVSDCSFFSVFPSPCVRLAGGTVGGHVQIEGWAIHGIGYPTAEIDGSVILGGLELLGWDPEFGAEAEIRSGSVFGTITTRDGTRLVVLGGVPSGPLHLRDTSVVEVNGNLFNHPEGDVAQSSGTLTGILADGRRLSLPFVRDAGATLRLVLVEPVGGLPQCGDGLDNDFDGSVDEADPGCADRLSSPENPQCQDAIDNDLKAGIDFDGGASLNGGVPIADPDPQCVGKPWRNSESGCGLGAELALVFGALGAWRRRLRAA